MNPCIILVSVHSEFVFFFLKIIVKMIISFIFKKVSEKKYEQDTILIS